MESRATRARKLAATIKDKENNLADVISDHEGNVIDLQNETAEDREHLNALNEHKSDKEHIDMLTAVLINSETPPVDKVKAHRMLKERYGIEDIKLNA